MFYLKHSLWGFCHDATLDGSSTPCSLIELQSWHRQYWVVALVVVRWSYRCCPVQCPLHPILLQNARSGADGCDLSHILMPRCRACTSKSSGGLHGVLSFTHLQFCAVWGTSALVPPDSR